MASYGIYDGSNIIARYVAPMSVRSNKPVFASDTLSLTRQVSEMVAQRWEIETRLEPLSYNAEDLFVHLVTKGHSVTTQASMPQNYSTILRRTNTNNIEVNTPASKGVNGVAITGMNGLIPKGTFIKFAGHNKIYMLVNDISSPGVATIFPSLVSNVIATETITWSDDVYGTFYFDLDVITGMTYTDGILMDVGTIKLVEAL